MTGELNPFVRLPPSPDSASSCSPGPGILQLISSHLILLATETELQSPTKIYTSPSSSSSSLSSSSSPQSSSNVEQITNSYTSPPTPPSSPVGTGCDPNTNTNTNTLSADVQQTHYPVIESSVGTVESSAPSLNATHGGEGTVMREGEIRQLDGQVVAGEWMMNVGFVSGSKLTG